MNVNAAGERPHLDHCVWFWAWAFVGAVLAVGLDVIVVLPVGLLLAVPLAVSPYRRRFWAGTLTGAGGPFLFVAYLQWQPGGLSPWPWLLIGVCLICAGFVVDRNENRAAA